MNNFIYRQFQRQSRKLYLENIINYWFLYVGMLIYFLNFKEKIMI